MSRTRTSVLTLVAAAVAVSAAAVGTTIAPADAARTTQGARQVAESTLSIRVPHSRIEAGDTTRVLGDLHVRGAQDPSGRTVTLEARPEGATDFTPVGTSVSGSRGGVSLEVAPTVTTKYRWYYAGAEDARPSKSGIARVVIVADQHHGRKIVTSLSIRAAHRIVGADGQDLVRGRLRTHGIGLRNRVVDLLTRTAADPTWQVVGQELTDSIGAVQFPITPTAPAAYRLVFEGTPVFRPSHSGVVRIGVRPTVTATVAPGQVDPGETVTVAGVAALAGQPLAGASVDLVARRAGNAGPRQVVGSGTTAADGSVAITDAPVVSTVYRLVVRHSAGVPRGTSPAVRVSVRAPSSLSIRGRHTSAGFAVSGLLRGDRHPVRSEPVELQTLAADGVTWTVVTSGLTNPHGKVTFLEPSSEGASYRLSYAGDTKLAPCVSGTVVS
jgi:hypothetical protein